VTIKAFSFSPPISSPLTSPISAATPSAVKIAAPMVLPSWLPTPTMVTAANEKIPGVLKSIPPVMITSI
jgi:hypothetical protein